MKRLVGIAVGIVLIISVVVVGIVLGVEKHQRDAAAAAERARSAAAQAAALANYQRLSAISSRIDLALAQFSTLKDRYDEVLAHAGQAGQRRHDLFNKSPNNAADSLDYVRTEISDVERLQPLSEAKANAARAAATAFGDHFGEGTISSLLADISVASEAEGKSLTEWSRAANDINDTLTARVNGQYRPYSDDDESLYKDSDQQDAVSASRWDTVASRMSHLKDRLAAEIATVKEQSGASQDATEEPASPSSVAAQTDNAAPQINSGNAPRNAASAEIADSPLSAGRVLPLLRATSALGVSTQANGATAYVTVPDTPARGTADPNRIWVGRMADGRWVGIVPLDSGGSAGVAYALMWVWTDGRAQFVGEIPAENGGLGRLSMSIENGEIHLQWPVYGSSDTKCCPSLVRTKTLTLDGIRLRPLSDTTAPAGRAP